MPFLRDRYNAQWTSLSQWITSSATTTATAPSWIKTVTTPSWIDIYRSQTATSSTLVWAGATGSTTATTSAYTSIYHVSDNWSLWENDVNALQYLSLARARVAITAERRILVARIQESERRQQQERAQIYAQQQRDIALARERSRELLLAHLTPKQRETFEKNGWFIVHGGRSDTKYRIRTDRISANIEVFEGDRVTHRLCGHLRHDLPQFDHILAQKVSLELDEEAFVRICNRHAA